ncbi:hypothetical protein FHX37_0249 [Haloactinospora alba]|uniref:Uncharacterized protein n=1 Tax=Haloactinospora alba TaxID=405555 RepID=A0A543NEX1_9ACTN|nr:hypothetical protein [Haloactinospora alba]TQN30372.1 hypothetical protein FHX37_0249 [Haloactinospora alba]
MLRHGLGLLTGLASAPLLWLGAAWSASRLREGAENGVFDAALGTPLGATAVAVLMTVGVAGGALAGTRISPLAALVAGGLTMGYPLWPLLAPASVNAALPGWVGSGSLLHPAGPALPLALPVGTLLFIAALAPSRWRRARFGPDAGPPPAGDHVPGPPVEPDRGPDPEPDHGGEETTTPFRRDEEGAPRRTVWRSDSGDDSGETRGFHRDDPR